MLVSAGFSEDQNGIEQLTEVNIECPKGRDGCGFGRTQMIREHFRNVTSQDHYWIDPFEFHVWKTWILQEQLWWETLPEGKFPKHLEARYGSKLEH